MGTTSSAPIHHKWRETGVILARTTLQRADGTSASLSDQVFRIDYIEPMDELRERFTKWLDDVIINSLAEWRKTLV